MNDCLIYLREKLKKTQEHRKYPQDPRECCGDWLWESQENCPRQH